MTPPDIQAALLDDMTRRAAEPEGVTVRVVTPDEGTARRVGPMLAAALQPERVWGEVLYSEPFGDDWLVTVEDLGPMRFTNRSGIPAPRGSR